LLNEKLFLSREDVPGSGERIMEEALRRGKGFFRSQHLIAIFLAAALFLSWFLFHRASEQNSGNVPSRPAIIVEATGQVKRPGIYFFEHAPSIEEVLAVAGGVTGKGTMPPSIPEGSVCTGTCVKVWSIEDNRVAITQELMAARKRIVLGIPLDANQAAVEELALLPYITENQAEEIVRLRERKSRFNGLEELLEIRGIDVEDLRRLKSYLTVRP
jgi:hypothetical protein